jgi:hypothetical protein
MKKIILCLGIMFLISGCNGATNNMKCNSTTTTAGLTTDTTYEIDYKDKDVKYVKITYKYNQENANTSTTDGVGTGTDGTTRDRTSDTSSTSATSDTTSTTSDKNDVVGGVVGSAVDDGIDAVTDTILDIAGIKTRQEQLLQGYNNITGFSYDVKDKDNDNEYTVIYKIDLTKISDTDLARFNIDRNIDILKTTYENQGYTCK